MQTKIIIQILLMLSISVSANANNHEAATNAKIKSYGGLEIGYLSEQAYFASISSWRNINPWLDIGMGLGARYNMYWKKTVIPVFLDLKASMPDKRISPFVSAKLGYALGGGLLLSPKLGLSYNVKQNNNIFLGIGYEMQQTGNTYYTKRIENSALLSLGITW